MKAPASEERAQDALTSVPEDPSLPLLTAALDPAAMLLLFRREFARMHGFHIESCSVDRIRYRRGARAVVQYKVRLVGPSGFDAREQWITALLYPRERARQVWKKLQRNVPTNASGGVLPPVAMVSESNLILEVFPFDRRLASLPALLKPQDLPFQIPGPWAAAPKHWTAEAVRYRAGLGCAIRWRHSDYPNGEGGLYVKAYRDEQGGETYRTLLSLGTALDGHTLTVPEPVAYLPDHRALVQREVTGRSLIEILENDDAPDVMTRVAQALAMFHRDAPLPERARSLFSLLDDMRRASALVSWVRPTLAEKAQSVVAEIADRLDEAEPAATHGDLKPDHILLGEDGFTLLDLDSFSTCDPVVDPASMVARLTSLGLRQPAMTGRIEAAARAFADAYFALVPSSWQRRFPPHRAGALLQEAAGCFRHQLPGWPALMDAVMGRALAALAHDDRDSPAHSQR